MRTTINLTDLPVEVRHHIYGYLFCHQHVPLWLGKPSGNLRPAKVYEPIFYTQLFRVSRWVYLDSIKYAYGANAFVLKDSFTDFMSLGEPALAAVQDLTVLHTSWIADTATEHNVWRRIHSCCTHLRLLHVELQSDLLVQVIPHLLEIFGHLPRLQKRPILILDLYVWALHFTFDPSDYDFTRGLDMLNGKYLPSQPVPYFMHPEERARQLPLTTERIVLSADVSSGALQSVDAYLARYPQSENRACFVKRPEPMPETGRRALGRQARFWYEWRDDGHVS